MKRFDGERIAIPLRWDFDDNTDVYTIMEIVVTTNGQNFVIVSIDYHDVLNERPASYTYGPVLRRIEEDLPVIHAFMETIWR